jgi:hypothetical protein
LRLSEEKRMKDKTISLNLGKEFDMGISAREESKKL